MCSIMASYKLETIKKLVKLNEHRGNFSWSITQNLKTNKDFGMFNFEVLESLPDDNYTICHIQAPTGGLIEDTMRIHPTVIGNSKLWHNGLLTPRGIAFLQDKLGIKETFDTYLLHFAIVNYGFEILSEIEGLFSCLLYLRGRYYLFRTKHGKIYVDDSLTLSSERFEDSKCINFDTVYEIDFENNKLIEKDKFKTKRFNYIIEGEII